MKLLFMVTVSAYFLLAVSCSSDGDNEEISSAVSSSSSYLSSSSSDIELSSSSADTELSSSSAVCTAEDNNDTHYCYTNSEMKEYGFVTDAAGQTYKTVVIGEQTWMAENMNYETESGSYCYKNDESNCEKYGRLYNLVTATKSICPEGYHIPNNDDWDKLIRYVDEQNDGGGSGNPYSSMTAGIYLKSKEGWKNCGSIGTETYECLDIYGFSALPGGHYSYGDFGTIEYIGNWWSTSEANGQSSAYFRSLNYNNGNAYCYVNPKTNAYSVRCVKD